jgi:hypothetical protein
MLHTDNDIKSAVAKCISGSEHQGARRQGEVIGDKPPVVK